MPGQGYHLAVARLVAKRVGRKFSQEMVIGTLLMDALNSASGSRRCSHFTGGAGCIIPYYTELRQCTKVQSWDSGHKKSYLVDPRIEMRLMEAANVHIPEGDYKSGIRIHLLADRQYDQLVQTQIFDVLSQKDNIIKVRSTGEVLDGATFRKELYASYPMLDNYAMKMAGIDERYVEDVKSLLYATMSDAHAEFIAKYLKFNSAYEWHDTEFFTKEIIDNLVKETVENIIKYLKW